jgi:mevalonate kinase
MKPQAAGPQSGTNFYAARTADRYLPRQRSPAHARGLRLQRTRKECEEGAHRLGVPALPALDALVECVLAQAGALGCKLTGAGFGGACVALVNAGSGEHVKLGALEACQQRGHRGSVLL